MTINKRDSHTTDPTTSQLLRMATVMPMDPRNRSLLLDAAAEIDRLRDALEEYACPGRGACPAPWNTQGRCSLGDACGLIAADALQARENPDG